MANPQKENGCTQIANDILEKLITSALNGTELAICLFIIRKTYGWNKLEDEISISQFSATVPVSKKAICTALNNLRLVKIITLVKKGDSKICSNRWAFNKNYDEWQLLKKSKLVKKTPSTSVVSVPQLVKKTAHTKDNIQNTITKDIKYKSATPPKVFQEGSEEFRLSTLLLDNILAFNPRLLKPDLQKWSAEVDKMLRIDKRSVEEIETLIMWVSQDTFWKANILSTAKLREKFDQLWSKASAMQQAKKPTYSIIS